MQRPSLPPQVTTVVDRLWSLDPPAIKLNLTTGYALPLHTAFPKAPRPHLLFNPFTKRHFDEGVPGPLGQDIIGRVAFAMHNLCLEREIHPTYVCGVPGTGEPFAEAFEIISGLSRLEMNASTNLASGQMSRPEFEKSSKPGAGDHVLIVDVLVGEVAFQWEVLKLVHSTGARATLLAFLDLEQGGLPTLMQEGQDVQTVIDLDALLEQGVHHGRVTGTNKQIILSRARDLAVYKASFGLI